MTWKDLELSEKVTMGVVLVLLLLGVGLVVYGSYRLGVGLGEGGR